MKQMNGIRWLFFDLGSTLVDESECYRQRILKMIAGSDVSYERFLREMTLFYRQGLKGDLLTAKQFGFTLPEWQPAYESLFPDTIHCLNRLHGTYRLGVIANQLPGTAERLHGFGIDRFFDVVVASAEEGFAKPDQRIFLLALRRAGCAPEQAVMIGDRPDNDIAPANRLGMTTVRVMRGFWQLASPTEEDAFPNHTVRRLEELCDLFLP